MSDDLKKPWDVDYVAPKPDTGASRRAAAQASLASSKKLKEKRKEDPSYNHSQGDPESKTSKRLKKVTAETMSDKRRIFYDIFLSEYLKDFSAPNAWVRAGGKVNSSTRQSYEALRTQYCQVRLQAIIESIEEEMLLTDKDIILGIKKEALSFGEGTSQTGRVAAWKLLAQLKGKLVKKTEVDNRHSGGVMLIPVHATTEEWEQVAQASQEQLKHDVRT